MKDLLIRNVPDDVHETLRTLAADQGKSLQELLLGQLIEVARPLQKQTLLGKVLTGERVPLTAEQIVHAVHQGRRYQ